MSDFQEKVAADVKKVKGLRLREEAKSALIAMCFGVNVAAVVCNPISLFTLLNGFFVWWSMKFFRPTVRKQMEYEQHLKFLSEVKEEKVWTPKD